MMRKYRKIVWALLLSSALISHPAKALYTSAQVSVGSFSPTCLDYCVGGVCVKLVCTPIGCYLRTVPLISHRLPDVVVSVYNNPGEISWLEARALVGVPVLQTALSLVASLLGIDQFAGGYKAASEQQGDGDEDEQEHLNNLKYKEVSIIGNPFVMAVDALLPDRYFCESEVIPFVPYMQTELDMFTWRTGIPEFLYPSTWIPGLREIGTLLPPQTWGSVKPRTGWIKQEYDVFAAAVAAQRAIDVATRGLQPHVYWRIPGVEPSDEDEDKWNMLAPNLEPLYCTTFGKDLTYNFGREAPMNDEGYGWLYWARHECCPGPGITVLKIRATQVCIDPL